MSISLEDNFLDVIQKAQKGLRMTDEVLFKQLGCSLQELDQLSDSSEKKQKVSSLAQALGLRVEPLVHLALRKPRPLGLLPANVLMFQTPFGEGTVNSYLLVDKVNQSAVAFDTGTDATELLKIVETRNLTLRYLFLTHGDGDHVLEMDRIIEKTGAEAWIGEGEPDLGASVLKAGDFFDLNTFSIQARSTRGHTPGGITYVTQGTIPQIAFVGDALYASSMGGVRGDYPTALKTNREAIFSLPEDALLFPGHGPSTTVGLEKKYNPFY